MHVLTRPPFMLELRTGHLRSVPSQYQVSTAVAPDLSAPTRVKSSQVMSSRAESSRAEPSRAESSQVVPPSRAVAPPDAAQLLPPPPEPAVQPLPADVVLQIVPSASQPGTIWQEGPEAAAASAQRAEPSPGRDPPPDAVHLLPSPPLPTGQPLPAAVELRIVPSALQPGTIWQEGPEAAVASAQCAVLPLGQDPWAARRRGVRR